MYHNNLQSVRQGNIFIEYEAKGNTEKKNIKKPLYWRYKV